MVRGHGERLQTVLMKNRSILLPKTILLSATTVAIFNSVARAEEPAELRLITMTDALGSTSPWVSDLTWLGDGSALFGSWNEPNAKNPSIVRFDAADLTSPKTIGSAEFPSVSPDGRWIAFLDGKRWKLLSLTDNKTIQIGDEAPCKPTVQAPPKWSRDSRYVGIIQMLRSSAAQGLREDDKNRDAVPVVNVGTASDMAELTAHSHQGAFVTIVDVRTPGHPKTIKLEESFAYYGDWGPTTEFYFVSMRGHWDSTDTYSALRKVDVLTMGTTEVYRSSGFMQSAAPRVSPDGRKIALALDVDNITWDDYVSLVTIDSASGQLTRLTTGLYVNPASYGWRHDGKSLYFSGRRGGLDQIYRVDLAGQVTRISQEEDRLYFGLQTSPDGQWINYSTEDGYGRADIRIRSTQSGQERILAVLADPTKAFHLGEFRHVRWESTDGLEIWGYLFLPPEFDPARKYPLYVDVHGGGPGAQLFLAGPLSVATTSSPLEWHAWAALGYVVFVPDMRSSGEYGPNVAASRYATKDWDFGGIQKDVEDIETGTRWLIDQGFIDSRRVAVFGHSAGGARVNLLLTRSNLYGAGIISDQIAAGALPQTIWLTSGKQSGVRFDESFTSRGVTFAEDPSVYTGGFVFDGYKSKTPTLILVGNSEKGAAPGLSSEVLFSMLRQYKVPTRMLRYLDDGHTPTTLASALHRYKEIRRWLEVYIPPREH